MSDSEVDPMLALHRLLDQQHTLEDELGRVAHLARETVTGLSHVGVSILDGDVQTTAAATDAEARTLDDAQYRLGDGPCLTAHRECRSVEVESMADDARWPEFAAIAVAHGVRGSLSMPLVVEGDSIGALNMYAASTGPFDEVDRQKAAAFAQQASIALANALSFLRVAELSVQLREAIETRDLIGQAKGILMAHHKINADEAFQQLRLASQHQNRKVRALAEDVTRLGELP